MVSQPTIIKSIIQTPKMKKNKGILFVIILIAVLHCKAQQNILVELGEADFINMVKQNHPIAKQAKLISQSAEANTLLSKGSFDPKLFYDYRNKNYYGTQYYKTENAGLAIPSWYGIDFKVGFENNYGDFINNENKTPKNGLFYSQISVPLAQGLMIDERRAALKKAELAKSSSEYEKNTMMNELLGKAFKAYWDWQLSYRNLTILKNSINIAQQRLFATIQMVNLGDRPAVDTVESSIQLQERKLSFEQAKMDFQNKSLALSNYLWTDNNIPLEITEKLIPESTENDSLFNKIKRNSKKKFNDEIVNQHPDMMLYTYKIKQLNIDKKLKEDKLKPNINVNYNPLSNSMNTFSWNNYKWGFTFGFPVLLRKERGELKMTKIKITNTELENSNKRNEIINKYKTALNELISYQQQYELYSKTVENYESLWLSEKKIFDSGESSLFMINSREMNLINAELKKNELLIKNIKASIEIDYSLGLLSNRYQP